LADAGVALEAARRDLCLKALNWSLRERGTPQMARALRVAWEPDFIRWQFDAACVPAASQRSIAQQFSQAFDELARQDWDEAERQALDVCTLRHDLGWAAEVAGWAAERRGDLAAAIERYALALEAPVFSDQAVLFRTQWFPPGYGKFAAFRLAELGPVVPEPLRSSRYVQLMAANHLETLKDRVHAYWRKLAEEAQARGDFRAAYQMLWRAGWDCGLESLMDYGPLLEEMAEVAQRGESPALARLALAHRRSLI
jgi:hypothetical protein